MPDLVTAHEIASSGQRLLGSDRMGDFGHVSGDQRNGFHFALLISGDDFNPEAVE
jgi:hypothetical protein